MATLVRRVYKTLLFLTILFCAVRYVPLFPNSDFWLSVALALNIQGIEDFEDMIGLTILARGLITAIVVYTLSICIGRWCVQRVLAMRTATDFNEGDRGE